MLQQLGINSSLPSPLPPTTMPDPSFPLPCSLQLCSSIPRLRFPMDTLLCHPGRPDICTKTPSVPPAHHHAR